MINYTMQYDKLMVDYVEIRKIIKGFNYFHMMKLMKGVVSI